MHARTPRRCKGISRVMMLECERESEEVKTMKKSKRKEWARCDDDDDDDDKAMNYDGDEARRGCRRRKKKAGTPGRAGLAASFLPNAPPSRQARPTPSRPDRAFQTMQVAVPPETGQLPICTCRHHWPAPPLSAVSASDGSPLLGCNIKAEMQCVGSAEIGGAETRTMHRRFLHSCD